jgi:protein O-GlcNAc transferase
MSKKPVLGELKTSKSAPHLETKNRNQQQIINETAAIQKNEIDVTLSRAQLLYNSGSYHEALLNCEKVYEADAYRTDNLLLFGAIHFQLRNFSESIFYNQQCIRVDPNFAEAYSNLGNALKELGDVKGATQFYMKVF